MNALVSIDVATLTPATVFAPGGVEAIVSKIEAEVSAEVFTLETPEGRERIKSVAYKVARSKTALDDMGKELVAGIKAQAATIDAERRTIRERLDALKESVRSPLTAWEDAEAARIDGHERALVRLIELSRPQLPGANGIRAAMSEIEMLAGRDWQEFRERAETAATDTAATLETLLAAAEQAERDQAELAELRKAKAEREAKDLADKIAAEVAENQRLRAIEQAERDAQEAERRAHVERQRQEQAEKDKIEAAARAVEQERERAARVKADEERAAAKREANKKHRAKVHGAIKDALADPSIGIDTETANRLIEAIGADRIPHVSILY